jgi:hypothetical protein
MPQTHKRSRKIISRLKNLQQCAIDISKIVDRAFFLDAKVIIQLSMVRMGDRI